MSEIQTNINPEYANKFDTAGAIAGFVILGIVLGGLIGFAIYACVITQQSIQPISNSKQNVSTVSTLIPLPASYSPDLIGVDGT